LKRSGVAHDTVHKQEENMIPNETQSRSLITMVMNVLRQYKRAFVLAALAMAGIYLLTAHTAHTVQLLPFAILFLCPLMHLFMHGQHGQHTDNTIEGEAREGKTEGRKISGLTSQHQYDHVHDNAQHKS
jgi:uncharacterized membrane protein